jgi:hypothetical protein
MPGAFASVLSAIVQSARSTGPGPRLTSSTNSACFSSTVGPGGLTSTSVMATTAGSGGSPVVSSAVGGNSPGEGAQVVQSAAASLSIVTSRRHSELPLSAAATGMPLHRAGASNGAGWLAP